MYSLMIVDDEPILLEGLCKYYPWKDIGFDLVAGCSDGNEAMNVLHNNSIDVVFTDISMPIVNGFKLAELIHNDYKSTMVVFLSCHADFKYAQKAIKLDVYDYILKPVSYKDILKVFQRVKKELDDARGLETEEEYSYYERIVSQIESLVEENIASVNMDMVSQEVNLSRNYLSYLYKQQTGRCFSDFLVDRKMYHARNLLSRGMKNYEIAEYLGYSDPKNFTRAFRTYHGMSPREFKNKGTNN